jgi:hypothetical protein
MSNVQKKSLEKNENEQVIDCQSWPSFKIIQKKSLVFILLGQTRGKKQSPIV